MTVSLLILSSSESVEPTMGEAEGEVRGDRELSDACRLCTFGDMIGEGA